jgi:hypothetical protein
LSRRSSIHAILPTKDHGSVAQLKNKETMDQDLLEYLQAFSAENAKRFDELGQRIEGTNQEVRSLREETTQFRQETAQRFDKLETEVRSVYIEVENLQGVVQLVAEGVTTVSHQLQRQGEEISERLDGVESFNRLLYKDLDSRMRRSRRPRV